MRWRISVVAALPAVLLQACSSIPISPESARPADVSREITTQSDKCRDCGTINITRDIGFLGGCSVTIYLDGTQVGELTSGSSLEFLATPGQHVIEADPSLYICAGNKIGVTVNLLPRQVAGFRVGRDRHATLIFTPSFVRGGEAPKNAKDRLQELDDLLSSGLISNEEYAKRRQAILNGL